MRMIMAPMRGYTDAVFREVWSRHFTGLDEAVAPFISLHKASEVSLKTLGELGQKGTFSLPVTPQMLGNQPEAFLDLARLLADQGYTELNWNLGCPFPMVAKKARGSGLLCHPDRVDAFLERVCAASPVEVSVKIRLGRQRKEEMEAIVPILNRYPLSRVMVHPRIGIQMYTGRPDLAGFERFRAACHHPLVYNGDIWSQRDFTGLTRRFPGITSWMLGRGLLADPFLAERLRGGFRGEREETLARFVAFYEELEAAYAARLSGPSHLLARMKGWWACFHQSFTEGERFFRKIRKIENLEAFGKAVQAFWDAEPDWQFSPNEGWVEEAEGKGMNKEA
jgi:tRNA-dihydrouridine synthase